MEKEDEAETTKDAPPKVLSPLPWFRVRNDLPDHPKVRDLCAILGNPTADAYWLRLLCWTARFCPGGQVGDGARTATGRIEDAVHYPGKPGELVAGLVKVGLLDPLPGGGFEVHDWWQEQGPIVHRAEKERLKKQAYRAREAAKRPPDTGGDVHGTGTGTSPGRGRGRLRPISGDGTGTKGVDGDGDRDGDRDLQPPPKPPPSDDPPRGGGGGGSKKRGGGLEKKGKAPDCASVPKGDGSGGLPPPAAKTQGVTITAAVAGEIWGDVVVPEDVLREMRSRLLKPWDNLDSMDPFDGWEMLQRIADRKRPGRRRESAPTAAFLEWYSHRRKKYGWEPIMLAWVNFLVGPGSEDFAHNAWRLAVFMSENVGDYRIAAVRADREREQREQEQARARR